MSCKIRRPKKNAYKVKAVDEALLNELTNAQAFNILAKFKKYVKCQCSACEDPRAQNGTLPGAAYEFHHMTRIYANINDITNNCAEELSSVSKDIQNMEVIVNDLGERIDYDKTLISHMCSNKAYIKMIKELNECVVLCSNCHRWLHSIAPKNPNIWKEKINTNHTCLSEFFKYALSDNSDFDDDEKSAIMRWKNNKEISNLLNDTNKQL